MGVVKWGLNWGGGLNWGETGLKKTYNYYPWNSGGGSYENLIQTPENLGLLRCWLKKQ